jgi:hypothetical protein
MMLMTTLQQLSNAKACHLLFFLGQNIVEKKKEKHRKMAKLNDFVLLLAFILWAREHTLELSFFVRKIGRVPRGANPTLLLLSFIFLLGNFEHLD